MFLRKLVDFCQVFLPFGIHFLALTFEVELGKELFFNFQAAKNYGFQEQSFHFEKVRFVDKQKMETLTPRSCGYAPLDMNIPIQYTTMEAFLRSERLMRKCMSDNFLGLSGEK